MLKSMIRLCLAGIALGLPSLGAFEPGKLLLSGELLYLKPAIDQTSFAIKSNQNAINGEVFPNGKRQNNITQYKPGFRVEALYQLCDEQTAVDGRFTYFNAGHSSATRGDFLFDTIGFPGDGAQIPEDTTYSGKAHVHDSFQYMCVDATFNRQIVSSCFDSLNLLIGLESTNLQYSRHFHSFGSFLDGSVPRDVKNSLKTRSRFWGVGPVLGLGYLYQLTNDDCCWGVFGLRGNVRGALLCGRSHSNFHFYSSRTAGSAGVNLKNNPTWKVVPTIDARLGGTYQRCFCGFNTFIELGYEWIWVHNGINNITGYDVAFAGDSIDLYNNFGIHGPYFRINFAF